MQKAMGNGDEAKKASLNDLFAFVMSPHTPK